MLPNSLTQHVWLCDDDEDDHLFFEQALKEVSPSSQLTSFYRCSKVLQQLQQSQPDLLFLDINLPRISGAECLKEIREQQDLAWLPVIMYTGSNYIIDVNACYGYGATLYVVKPAHAQALATQLKRLFELDWNHWRDITVQQFNGRQYLPFGAE